MERLPESTESRLVFRNSTTINWIGAMLAFTGIIPFLDGKHSAWGLMCFLGFAVLMFLIPNVMTISVDKSIGLLTLEYRSILKVTSKKEIPLNELLTIRLERSRGKKGSLCRCQLVVITKDGKETPFGSYIDRHGDQEQQLVDQLRAFIGIGGD